MLKKLLIILIIVNMIGCCAIVDPTYTSDGQIGYIISCSGSAFDWDMCYKKAGEICGKRGYVIFEQNSDIIGKRINRNMLIKCK